MTLYVKTITVETSYNSETNTKSAEIEIREDVVFYIGVRFPPGPATKLKIAIFYGEEQIFPSSKGEWCSGDNEVLWDYIMWEVPEKPCKLRIKGYNTSTTYDHSAIIRIIALPKWVLYGIKMLSRLAYFMEILAKYLIGV